MRLGGVAEKTSPGKSTLAGLYVGMRTRMLRRSKRRWGGEGEAYQGLVVVAGALAVYVAGDEVAGVARGPVRGVRRGLCP